MVSSQSKIVTADIPPRWSCKVAGVTCVDVSKLASILGVSGISESKLKDDVSGVSILCCERMYME